MYTRARGGGGIRTLVVKFMSFTPIVFRTTSTMFPPSVVWTVVLGAATWSAPQPAGCRGACVPRAGEETAVPNRHF